MADKTFRDKLTPAPQKKLLTCDGGGIRGVLSLGILEGIESLLRAKTGDPKLVLSDFFDYVAGTSTGAIIATCIARGMAVADIRKFYVNSRPAMFSKAGLLERFRNKYAQEKLAAQLQDVLGKDTTLGSDSLRTLLMMVMRNATTDSPWPLSNNPLAKYNDGGRKDCNLHLPLWQLVRANTAAPTWLPAGAGWRVGENRFLFVDGGVTICNNPAFQLFSSGWLVEAFNLKWPTGTDKMLIVSVGTGTSPQANTDLQPGEMNLLYNASSGAFGADVCGAERTGFPLPGVWRLPGGSSVGSRGRRHDRQARASYAEALYLHALQRRVDAGGSRRAGAECDPAGTRAGSGFSAVHP